MGLPFSHPFLYHSSLSFCSHLGGIITGIIAGQLYNRFQNVKLPEWLGFFSGRRFVPIVTSLSMVILAGIAGLVWPPIL
jgi:PTS system N-acetylglucosamine-specific IIC component